jgi:uncharacterized protein (DUF849 family)
MAHSNKVIITCAVTGAIHTPSMSPYLPVTADEIAEAAIGAAEAGAAIVHLHARDEKTGKPDQSPEAFGRFLPRIKQASTIFGNLPVKFVSCRRHLGLSQPRSNRRYR